MTNEKIKEVIENWGSVVNDVQSIVDISDADGAYTTFEDAGMFSHAECVEFLYFDS